MSAVAHHGPAPRSDAGAGHLAVEGVAKAYGKAYAVDGVSLTLQRGEFVTLLGDSGCGKTTLLRLIAGFVRPDRGRVLAGGTDITALSPADRRLGVVFQSYALFPTKTVAQNIGFPLMLRRRPAGEIARRVRELAELVELGPLLSRFPAELSGGQQQRVALARALASEPEALLLDEPMSALDARIRGKLRTELRALVTRLGLTTLYVTHDQEEALALSDRVAVMRAGRIEQVDTPTAIYHRPASRFVASFIGSSNLVDGRVVAGGIHDGEQFWPARLPAHVAPGEPVTVLYRPEDIVLAPAGATQLGGRVETAIFAGATLRLVVIVGSGRRITVDVPSLDAPPHSGPGSPVSLKPDPARAVILERGA